MENEGTQYLVIDIETIPVQSPAHIAYLTENVTPRANLKDQTKIDADIKAKAADISSKTALTGLWGEIVSVGWAVDDKDIRCDVREIHTPERRFLMDVGNQLGKALSGRVTWVGFNLGFDTRFLFQRCVINDVKWPVHIPADMKPWSPHVFDVLYHWCGTDIRGNSLGNLSQAFGLGRKTDDPTMLEYYWKNDQHDKIRAYNMQDVHLTRELFRKIRPYR